MSKTAQEKRNAEAPRALRRLLEALGETGARAAASDLEDAMLVVLAPRNGVTVVRARLPAATGDAALAQGLAEWERDGLTRRMKITDAGRAYLRRAASDRPQLDPFRAQHGEFQKRAVEKGARPALVNEAESPSPGWRDARGPMASLSSTPRMFRRASASAATSNRRSFSSASRRIGRPRSPPRAAARTPAAPFRKSPWTRADVSRAPVRRWGRISPDCSRTSAAI